MCTCINLLYIIINFIIFNNLLRYEETIAGQFFGHTHKDELEIFYDNDDPSKAIKYEGIIGSRGYLMMSYYITV